MTTQIGRNSQPVILHNQANEPVEVDDGCLKVTTTPYLGFCRSFEGYDIRLHEFTDNIDANFTIDGDATNAALKLENTLNPNTGAASIVSKKKLDLYGTTRIEFSCLVAELDGATQSFELGLTNEGINGGDEIRVAIKGTDDNTVSWSHAGVPVSDVTLAEMQSDRNNQIIIGIEISNCAVRIYEKIDGESIYLGTVYQNVTSNDFPTLGKLQPFLEINATAGDVFEAYVFGWRTYHQYSPIPAINRYMTRNSIRTAAQITVAAGTTVSAGAITYKTDSELRSVYLQSVTCCMLEAAAGALGMISIQRNPTGTPTMTADLGDRTVVNHNTNSVAVTADGEVLYSKPILSGNTEEIICDPPIELYPGDVLQVVYEGLDQIADIWVGMNWLED